MTIKQAIALARQAHEGQVRKWSAPDEAPVPYLSHPMAVARHVHELGLGEVATMAAMLHDVLEDTAVPAEEIQRVCGDKVLKMVEELTNRRQPGEENLSRAERKCLDRERLATISDTAKQIKLCDRIHNLKSMRHAPREFVRKYLAESRLLIPVLADANRRLGAELERTINEIEEQLNGHEAIGDSEASQGSY
jgi:(p)ppGpp synthase/HD superfamily hydrolase